jgi:hypothetical protein
MYECGGVMCECVCLSGVFPVTGRCESSCWSIDARNFAQGSTPTRAAPAIKGRRMIELAPLNGRGACVPGCRWWYGLLSRLGCASSLQPRAASCSFVQLRARLLVLRCRMCSMVSLAWPCTACAVWLVLCQSCYVTGMCDCVGVGKYVYFFLLMHGKPGVGQH